MRVCVLSVKPAGNVITCGPGKKPVAPSAGEARKCGSVTPESCRGTKLCVQVALP